VATCSPEFQAAVAAAVGSRSSRVVAELAGGEVSHALISRMLRSGYIPSVEIIVSLARAVGTDPNALLDAAGKPRYVRYVPEGE